MKKVLMSLVIATAVACGISTSSIKEAEAQPLLGNYCCNGYGVIVCGLNDGPGVVGRPCFCFGVAGTGYICR